MGKFNMENLLSSLFIIGFDQVDSTLFTIVLGKINLDQREKQQYEYIKEDFSELFKYFVDYDGFRYKLKKDFSLSSDTKENSKKEYTLKQYFISNNRKLIKYLKTLDYEDIIINKINLIGINNISNFSYFFSEYEKEIINKMFGIEELNNRNVCKYIKNLNKIYNQDNYDIDIIVKSLIKLKNNNK